MRIVTVNIPKENIKTGLDDIYMDKLGSTVLLVGKNGAGKSRLLQEIINAKARAALMANINPSNAEELLDTYNKKLKESKEKIEKAMRRLEDNGLTEDVKAKLYENIHAQKGLMNYYEDRIMQRNGELKNRDEIITDNGEAPNILHFCPDNSVLKTTEGITRQDILRYSSKIDELGFLGFSEGVYIKIEEISNRWFNATHPNSEIPNDEKIEAIEEYDFLQKLIHIFLDTEIGRDVNGGVTLFGLPIEAANLSNGQKILLMYSLAILRQGKSLDNLILFMDEPENHVHPSAIISVLNRLRDYTPNGQIWIATHSVPLLSYFDPSDVWFVDDRKVSYSGRKPEQILHRLLGGEEGIAKLQEFISLPAVFALNRYAYESLIQPFAVNTGKQDPQTLQIRNSLKKHLVDEKKLKILDFGAGKGRLLANVWEHKNDFNQDIETWLDYVAFDEYDTDKTSCIDLLKVVYSDNKRRYFNDTQSLLSIHDKESFDIVVLSNVLHEIDPKDWLKIFGENGSLVQMLAENGVLCIVEDQEMLIGEKAYQKGFIVLDTPELKELFAISAEDSGFVIDSQHGGRLKLHQIEKKLLKRISASSRVSALKMLKHTAANKILEIRKQEPSYKNGKRHGFWVQQLANSTLALSELDI